MSRAILPIVHPFSIITVLALFTTVFLLLGIDIYLALGLEPQGDPAQIVFFALIGPLSVAGVVTLTGWIYWRSEWVIRKDLWSAVKRFLMGIVLGPLIAYPFFTLDLSTVLIPLGLFLYVTSISFGLYTYAEYLGLEDKKREIRERLGRRCFLDGEHVYPEVEKPIYFCERCLSLIPDSNECWRCGETFEGNLVKIDLSKQTNQGIPPDTSIDSAPSG